MKLPQIRKRKILSLNEYWKNNNFIYNWVQAMDDDRLWPFTQTGWVLPPRGVEDPSKFGMAFNGLGINN